MDMDIQNCMFHNWYNKFRKVTFKSTIISLPHIFVEYLNADGVYMPASAFPKYKKDPYDEMEDDEDWEDEGEENDESAPVPSFPELEQEISQAIEQHGGEVFPKLNWSSPKDAIWMSVSGNLKCQTPHDIFLLLKSSDFVNYDLEQLALGAEPGTLVLRKWYDLNQSMEFRCFVFNNTLVGISQRDHTNFYNFLLDMKDTIQSKIEEFFTTHIQNQFPSDSYIFDVYITTKSWRVWLIDFAPWNSDTEGLMFDWDELSPEPNWEGVSVRFVESQSTIRPTLAMTNRLPADLVLFPNSAKSTVDEWCQQMKDFEGK